MTHLAWRAHHDARQLFDHPREDHIERRELTALTIVERTERGLEYLGRDKWPAIQ